MFNSRDDWQPPFAAEPIHLEMNLRNTRPVADITAGLVQMTGSFCYAVNEGAQPEIISYATTEEMTQRILKIVGSSNTL